MKLILCDLICVHNVLVFKLNYFLLRGDFVYFLVLDSILELAKTWFKIQICFFTELYLIVLSKAWCGCFLVFITNKILLRVSISVKKKVKYSYVIFFDDIFFFW